MNLSPAALLTTEVQSLLLQYAGHGIGVEITANTSRSTTTPHWSPAPGCCTNTASRSWSTTPAPDSPPSATSSNWAPDLIKLDVSLVRDINDDLVRRALARSLTMFAAETGAQLIAEGIETPAERDTLHGLGITYGQGFLYGRPDSLPRTVATGGDRPATAPR